MSSPNNSGKQKRSETAENIKTVVLALALAIIFRSFLFEPFHIPSSSMKDTLLIGDFIFVSKSSYGYSRYSFPLGLPLFKGRIFASEPQRGDVIVFRLPTNPRVDYIKRLIGLPGDRIQVRDGVLYLNGQAVKRERVADMLDMEDEEGGSLRLRHLPKYKETLPEGRQYYTLDAIEDGVVDNTVEYTVPEGHYFFMGDNRDHSIDSRYTDQVGFVPFENLVGRANVIAFSVKKDENPFKFWRWGEIFRGGRIWKHVQLEEGDLPPSSAN